MLLEGGFTQRVSFDRCFGLLTGQLGFDSELYILFKGEGRR